MVERGKSALSQVLALAAKGAQEIRTDPLQFIDARRRAALVANGMGALRGIARQAQIRDRDLLQIIDRAYTDIECYELPDGTESWHDANCPVIGTVFPKNTEISYQPDEPNMFSVMTHKLDNVNHRVVGPTVSKDDLPYMPPLFGLRRGDIVMKPLFERHPDSQVQHGGIVVTPRGGTILNWSELTDLWNSELGPYDSLLQGDWFVDKAHADELASRENMQEARPYNAIGQMFFADGSSQWMAISGAREAQIRLINSVYTSAVIGTRFNVAKPSSYFEPLIHYVVAQAEVIASSHRAVDWRLLGLEFRRGGYFPPKTFRSEYGHSSGILQRDYFELKVPKSTPTE